MVKLSGKLIKIEKLSGTLIARLIVYYFQTINMHIQRVCGVKRKKKSLLPQHIQQTLATQKYTHIIRRE